MRGHRINGVDSCILLVAVVEDVVGENVIELFGVDGGEFSVVADVYSDAILFIE